MYLLSSIQLLISFVIQTINSFVTSIIFNVGVMEFKEPPNCECGNGPMVLRKAGDYSTRPGSYYYICPGSLKHRNRYFWYDDYNSKN